MERGPIEVHDPWSGVRLGTVPRGTGADVDAALARAHACLHAGDWPAHARAALLDRAADALAEQADDFAQCIRAEAGKPIALARAEVQRAVSTLTFSAAAARTVGGESLPMDAAAAGVGKLAFTVREPVGIVAAVTPFNFPLNLVVHKVGPALAAGCAVVLKPSEKTPLVADRLLHLLESCGLPDGRLSIVHGIGADIVPALATHPDVSLVSFTGSGRVAASLHAVMPAGRPFLTELGGSAPMLVQADADLGRAARAAAVGAFAGAGQSCISVQRVYVQRAARDAFLEALLRETDQLVVGDPGLPDTLVGPLIRPEEAARVRTWVDEAVAGGGSLLRGGEWRAATPSTHHACIVQPVILTDVAPDARVVCEEVFGPVLVLGIYDTLDEGIRLANRSAFGLNAAVFTASVGDALTAARGLVAGTVLVNESPTWRSDPMPYGGVGASGNTREGPAYALRAFTREKLVVLQS